MSSIVLVYTAAGTKHFKDLADVAFVVRRYRQRPLIPVHSVIFAVGDKVERRRLQDMLVQTGCRFNYPSYGPLQGQPSRPRIPPMEIGGWFKYSLLQTQPSRSRIPPMEILSLGEFGQFRGEQRAFDKKSEFLPTAPESDPTWVPVAFAI
jgi:hypothetical protein